MISLATGLMLGLLLGVRHALEPDHLAAISVLVTRRRSPWGGAVLGACWGVGHSLALLAVACVLAAIGARLPTRWADGFELLVAAMLLALGGRAVLRAVRSDATDDADAHHMRAPGTMWSASRQPLLVGLVHGLAGSGALTALALASLPTTTTRLLYIALFGMGSVIGMTCLTGLAGWPLARLEHHRRLSRLVGATTGAFSLLLGGLWGWSVLHSLGAG